MLNLISTTDLTLARTLALNLALTLTLTLSLTLNTGSAPAPKCACTDANGAAAHKSIRRRGAAHAVSWRSIQHATRAFAAGWPLGSDASAVHSGPLVE